MSNKSDSIIGKTLEEFHQLFSVKNGVHKYPARLIPTYKPGDEMALTAVFLSSLRLIKEFRREICRATKLPLSGSMYAFTEVRFKEFGALRLDGLIVFVKGGVIRDAAIYEMKNGASVLTDDQITNYIKIARKYSIPKIIGVSNEFVSSPEQSPLNIKAPKDITLYHLSWTYILTIAHILLFNNDLNIDDPDQVEIMKEVVRYLEHEKSGIKGFTQMKPGWKQIVERINAGATLSKTDSDLIEAVHSWVQEEQDMALMLSRELGILVETGGRGKKGSYAERIDQELSAVIKSKTFETSLKIDGAASEVNIRANLGRRNVEMQVILNAPGDSKTIKGQVGWLKNQLKFCGARGGKVYECIEKELCIHIRVKHQNTQIILLSELDAFVQNNKSADIKEFGIAQVKDLGKNFSNPKKFIATIELMMLNYYRGVVQFLKKWEKLAPRMPVENNDDDYELEDSGKIIVPDLDPDEGEVLRKNVENENESDVECIERDSLGEDQAKPMATEIAGIALGKTDNKESNESLDSL